tara:strand:- start:1608 stop:2141 length:534 start_codon:yes stop_codon:yes gene_type:complete
MSDINNSKILNSQEKLDLNNLIKANDSEDCTQEIRNKKQSKLIRSDVKHMLFLKNKYSRLIQSNPNEFDKICVSQCQFLFNNYTDIYNKIKNNTLNLDIFDKFLNVLKEIEDGELNQHEGSFIIGKLLKELYIDSALRNQEQIDAKTHKKKIQKKPSSIQNNEKKISYKDFKIMHTK